MLQFKCISTYSSLSTDYSTLQIAQLQSQKLITQVEDIIRSWALPTLCPSPNQNGKAVIDLLVAFYLIHLKTPVIWKTENIPNQILPRQRKFTLTGCLFALAIFCITQKTDPVLTQWFYSRVTAPAPIALVHMSSSLTEKWCGLIQHNQIVLNPGALGSSWTVQKRVKYEVTTCGVLRA